MGQGARPAVPETHLIAFLLPALCCLAAGGSFPEGMVEVHGIPADRAEWGDQSDSDKDHS